MTYEEIVEYLKTRCNNVYDLWDSGDGEFSGNNELFQVGDYRTVFKQDPDGDRDYSQHQEKVCRVLYFHDHNVYLKITGYYSSYSGTEFDGWSCVTESRPEEKIIIVYN